MTAPMDPAFAVEPPLLEVPATFEVIIVRRWRCSTCRKSWASKARCVAHIRDGCWRDLTVRSCATCRHDYRADDETAAHCEVDARPDDEQIVRRCPAWEAR